MGYKYTKDWLDRVDRSSTEFLAYCEGRALARLGLSQGSLGIQVYLKEVSSKRGAAAAESLRQLGHEVFLHEGDAVLKPICPPERG